MTRQNTKDTIKALRDEYMLSERWVEILNDVMLDNSEELSRLRRMEDMLNDNGVIKTLRDTKSNSEWRRIIGYLKRGAWITNQ
jgi:hypothetical protein